MNLNAEIKTQTGKGINRKLRRDGRVPAILYGKHQDPVPLSVDDHEVEKLLSGGAGRKLINLKVAGLTAGADETMVMFKDIQRNALSGKLTHLDLYGIRRGEKITIVLPLTFIGDAHVDEKGGTLQYASREIEIECLPRNIPDAIEVDVSNIEIGHSLVMGDVILPEDIKLVDDPARVVASIVAVRTETEEKPESDEETGEADQETSGSQKQSQESTEN